MKKLALIGAGASLIFTLFTGIISSAARSLGGNVSTQRAIINVLKETPEEADRHMLEVLVHDQNELVDSLNPDERIRLYALQAMFDVTSEGVVDTASSNWIWPEQLDGRFGLNIDTTNLGTMTDQAAEEITKAIAQEAAYSGEEPLLPVEGDEPIDCGRSQLISYQVPDINVEEPIITEEVNIAFVVNPNDERAIFQITSVDGDTTVATRELLVDHSQNSSFVGFIDEIGQACQ